MLLYSWFQHPSVWNLAPGLPGWDCTSVASLTLVLGANGWIRYIKILYDLLVQTQRCWSIDHIFSGPNVYLVFGYLSFPFSGSTRNKFIIIVLETTLMICLWVRNDKNSYFITEIKLKDMSQWRSCKIEKNFIYNMQLTAYTMHCRIIILVFHVTIPKNDKQRNVVISPYRPWYELGTKYITYMNQAHLEDGSNGVNHEPRIIWDILCHLR